MSTHNVHERKLADCELAYFLPSRGDGVNDMYLHLGFRAPERLLDPQRLQRVWAILRLRHPLLSATVCMHDYDDVRFIHKVPASAEECISDANDSLSFSTKSRTGLIDEYLNGPRTLSDTRLSYLIVSSSVIPNGLLTPPEPGRQLEENADPAKEYDILICAVHFIGDGMALHTFANEFFTLLTSNGSVKDLEGQLRNEWRSVMSSTAARIPRPATDRLSQSPGRLGKAAARVAFELHERKQIGGHALPRHRKAPVHTVVPTTSLNKQKTKQVLEKCKQNGVSVANAMFAICNFAWLRTTKCDPAMPMMLYSALNVRPFLEPVQDAKSYWFTAVGFFNIILPSSIPPSTSCSTTSTFWHRAMSVKKQCAKEVADPLLVTRTLEMARFRGERARMWAMQDDGKMPDSQPALHKLDPSSAPSVALTGLSLLGDLDRMYKHATYPAVHLHTLTTGSRQRSGANLIFVYTFASQLWLSFGYDENGLQTDLVETFWGNVLDGVEEFLLV